jgi:hypothetical protein
MKRKLLTTTLLSMSLLSLNVSASGQMKCANGVCMVEIKKPSPSVEKIEAKKDTNGYKTVLIDNIETIVFSHSKYIMTQDEVMDYDLEQMQKSLLTPSLNTDLPISDYLCSDNLQAVQVLGVANTYECT